MKRTPQDFFSSPIGETLTFEKCITCGPMTNLEEVIQLVAKHNIGALVVVENSHPIGIITERDFMTKVLPQKIDFRSALVGTFMTSNPTCVRRDAPMNRIMAALRLGRFRHLIVTDEQNNLIGVISMKDIFYRLDDFFRESAT